MKLGFCKREWRVQCLRIEACDHRARRGRGRDEVAPVDRVEPWKTLLRNGRHRWQRSAEENAVGPVVRSLPADCRTAHRPVRHRSGSVRCRSAGSVCRGRPGQRATSIFAERIGRVGSYACLRGLPPKAKVVCSNHAGRANNFKHIDPDSVDPAQALFAECPRKRFSLIAFPCVSGAFRKHSAPGRQIGPPQRGRAGATAFQRH